MGHYNILSARRECPFCHTVVPMRIQFKYGFNYMVEYQLGDEIRWEDSRCDTGVPTEMLVVLDAAVESCPNCCSRPEVYDLDACIHVRSNILESVEPASGKYDFAAAKETFLLLE